MQGLDTQLPCAVPSKQPQAAGGAGRPTLPGSPFSQASSYPADEAASRERLDFRIQSGGTLLLHLRSRYL